MTWGKTETPKNDDLEKMSPTWSRLLAGDGPEADKDNLIRLIFSSLDHDSNFILNYAELYQVRAKRMEKLLSEAFPLRDIPPSLKKRESSHMPPNPHEYSTPNPTNFTIWHEITVHSPIGKVFVVE